MTDTARITGEPPSLRDELARKAVDQLTLVMHRHSEGDVSSAEAAFVARSLWHATSGLVPEDVSQLLGQAADECEAAPRKRHFYKGGQVVTIVWKQINPDAFIVQTRHAAGASTSTKRDCGVGGRADMQERFIAGLKHAGFIEL